MAKRKESKREKNRKRKILLALLLVIFTGVILTANTYAWFTSNKTITVDAIDVQVTTANGIQVSTDATNWKTVITNTDLNNTLLASTLYPTNTNQLPFKSTNALIAPVSTGGTVASGKLKMFLGELGTNESNATVLKTTAETDTKGATGNYVAFDLFFLVTQNSVVKLGSGSSVTTSTGATNKGLKNAARVAWIKEGNAAAGDVSSAQGLANGTEGTTLIWEPNNNVHTDAAIADALSTYGVTIQSDTEVANYYGVDAAIGGSGVILKPITPGTNFKQVTPGLKTRDGALTSDQDWFSLDAGITKVRFYLWVEGQDYDCENNASGDAISFNMNFVLPDTTTNP